MHPSNKTFNFASSYTALCKRWTIQMLIQMGGHKNSYNDFFGDEIDFYADLGIVATDKDNNYSRQIAIENMRAELSKIVKNKPKLPTRTILAKNIQWLADNLGLNELEQKLILFFVLERQCDHLRSATYSLGNLNTTRIFSNLALLLQTTATQRWPSKTGLADKCRTCSYGRLNRPQQESKDEKTETESYGGIQGEGGRCRVEGRQDLNGTGREIRHPCQPDRGMANEAAGSCDRRVSHASGEEREHWSERERHASKNWPAGIGN